MKGIRVTLKIIQAESFAGHSRVSQVAKSLTKYSLALDSSTFSMCFSCDLLRVVHSRVSRKQVANFTVLRNLHQLNAKPSTNKSHKIQGNKLMQLLHFLSWNKANLNVM